MRTLASTLNRYKGQAAGLAAVVYLCLWGLSVPVTANVVLQSLQAPFEARLITLPFMETSEAIPKPPSNHYHIKGKLSLLPLSTADTLVITSDNCLQSVKVNDAVPAGMPDMSEWKDCNFGNRQLVMPLPLSGLHPGTNDFDVVFSDEGGAYGINITVRSVWLKKSLMLVVPALFVMLACTALGASRKTLRSRGNWMAAGLLLIGVCSIALTYDTLSQTYDESAHIPAGMQWWDKGEYTYEYMHMPLARIAGAALLYLADITPQGDYHGSFIDLGNRLLNADDAYTRNLTLARMGILPFYVLAGCMVFLWSRRLYGEKTALLSLLLYVASPMLAGHAGLATTDFTYGAMFVTALFAFILWLDTPAIAMSLFMGVCMALMLLSKISAVVQFPVAAAMVLEWHIYHGMAASRKTPAACRLHLTRLLFVALPAALILLDACYFFDNLQGLIHAVQEAGEKDKSHQAIWLFGPLNNQPVWYYFPVAFLFKNPLPFMALAATGIACNMRRRAGLLYQHRAQFPAIAAFAVILASTISHINIGSRHVLPSFMLLTIPAGYGLSRLLAAARRYKRVIGYALLLWQLTAFLRIAPDYIAYFNELASTETPPLLDTDFDWGQDLLRLKAVLQDKQIREVTMCVFGDADTARVLGVKVNPCPLGRFNGTAHGWLADSAYWYELWDKERLKGKPYVMVGKTIRLYDLRP